MRSRVWFFLLVKFIYYLGTYLCKGSHETKLESLFAAWLVWLNTDWKIERYFAYTRYIQKISNQSLCLDYLVPTKYQPTWTAPGIRLQKGRENSRVESWKVDIDIDIDIDLEVEVKDWKKGKIKYHSSTLRLRIHTIFLLLRKNYQRRLHKFIYQGFLFSQEDFPFQLLSFFFIVTFLVVGRFYLHCILRSSPFYDNSFF